MLKFERGTDVLCLNFDVISELFSLHFIKANEISLEKYFVLFLGGLTQAMQCEIQVDLQLYRQLTTGLVGCVGFGSEQ